MKRLITLSGAVLCLMFSGLQVHAQTNVKNTGKFALSVNGGAKNEIKYRVSPAYPNNILLEIQPASPFLLEARIINEKGAEQIKLKNEEVTLRYANSIDISKLAKGNYFIEIATGSGKNVKIAFTR